MNLDTTAIVRKSIINGRYSDVEYRYFSDDVRFTCSHISKIDKIAANRMDDDDKDYLYELCNYDIAKDYITQYGRDMQLEILNAMKKVLGSSTFSEVVRQAKAAD